jgi:hypothetical protein
VLLLPRQLREVGKGSGLSRVFLKVFPRDISFSVFCLKNEPKMIRQSRNKFENKKKLNAIARRGIRQGHWIPDHFHMRLPKRIVAFSGFLGAKFRPYSLIQYLGCSAVFFKQFFRKRWEETLIIVLRRFFRAFVILAIA